MDDLKTLLQRCEDVTRRLLGYLAAVRLGNWRRHTQTEQSLIEYVERLLWGEHRENGRRIDQQGGLSLERIVLDHCPDLFTEADKQQAKRTLKIA